VCLQLDVLVVRVQDTVAQLQKFDDLTAEVKTSIEEARALVKDSESYRQVLLVGKSNIVF